MLLVILCALKVDAWQKILEVGVVRDWQAARGRNHDGRGVD